jgi:hypothetical protein
MATIPSPHILVRSFGRFNEMLYLVDNSPGLTERQRELAQFCGEMNELSGNLSV